MEYLLHKYQFYLELLIDSVIPQDAFTVGLLH